MEAEHGCGRFRGTYTRSSLWTSATEGYIQDTVKRALELSNTGGMFIVCNETCRFCVSAGPLECGRREVSFWNRFPAIRFRNCAGGFCDAGAGDVRSCLLLSDHILQNTGVLAAGGKMASLLPAEAIVTFGAMPEGSKTGFGYIRQGEPLGDERFYVAKFVEKPDVVIVSAMLEDGVYLEQWYVSILCFCTPQRTVGVFAGDFRTVSQGMGKTKRGRCFCPLGDSCVHGVAFRFHRLCRHGVYNGGCGMSPFYGME